MYVVEGPELVKLEQIVRRVVAVSMDVFPLAVEPRPQAEVLSRGDVISPTIELLRGSWGACRDKDPRGRLSRTAGLRRMTYVVMLLTITAVACAWE